MYFIMVGKLTDWHWRHLPEISVNKLYIFVKKKSMELYNFPFCFGSEHACKLFKLKENQCWQTVKPKSFTNYIEWLHITYYLLHIAHV